MKKIIYVLTLIMYPYCSVLAQNDQCQEQGIRTNPDDPFETRTSPVDANGTVIFLNNGKFDWRTNPYSWTHTVNGITLTQNIISPYIQPGNPNTIGYIDNIPADNKPEDGWELVKYDFGLTLTGASIQTDHPRFILYNRYTGILRIFIYFNCPITHADYETGRIRLSYWTGTGGTLQSALLTYVEKEAVPLDDFNKRLGYINLNQTTSTTGQWLVADFPMAYDPCTCLFEYDLLYIALELVQNSTVTLSGRITTTDHLLVSNRKKVGTYPNSFKAEMNSKIVNTANGAIEVISEGQKTFKTSAEFLTNLSVLLNTEKNSNKKDNMQDAIDNLNGVFGLAPELNAAVGLINFFIGGGKEGNQADGTPTSFDADVNIAGNIETTFPATFQYLVVPGSIPKPGTSIEYYPMYNEVLGVFSLLETPELEFVDYLWNNWPSCPSAYSSPPAVRHFTVTKPIQYAVNPAAHLEIEKFDATFTITYDAGNFPSLVPPMDYFADPPFTVINHNIPMLQTSRVFPRPFMEYGVTGATYEERLNNIGMGIETWNSNYPNNGQVVLNTSWLPVGAIQDQSFMLYRDAYYGNNAVSGCYDGQGRIPDPIINFKVYITFKRTDNPNAQKVVFVATFKVKFKPHPIMATNPGAFLFYPEIGISCPEDPMNFCGLGPNPGPLYFSSVNNLSPSGAEYFNFYRLPFDLELENTSVGPGTVQAINTIKVGNNVTIAPGTIFNASKQITVEPTNNVDPTVVMQLQYPTANAALNPESIKTTNFSSICNNLYKYNPIVPEGEMAPPMPDGKANPILQPNDFIIYPNPASLQAKIVYNIANDANARITIMDAMGKEVISVVNGFHAQGQYTQGLDASQLPAGIYFCRLERNGEVSIKKFTIIK